MIISRKEAARRQSRELSNNSEARGWVLGAGAGPRGRGLPREGAERRRGLRPPSLELRPSALCARAQAAGSGAGGARRSGRPEGGPGQAPSQSSPGPRGDLRRVSFVRGLGGPSPTRRDETGGSHRPLRPGGGRGRVQRLSDPPPSRQDFGGRHPGTLPAPPAHALTSRRPEPAPPRAAGLQAAWEARGGRGVARAGGREGGEGGAGVRRQRGIISAL